MLEEVQVLEEPDRWVLMTDLWTAEHEKEETLNVTLGSWPNVKRFKVPVVETLNTVESEAVTMDYSPNRLNIEINRAGRIGRVSCG